MRTTMIYRVIASAAFFLSSPFLRAKETDPLPAPEGTSVEARQIVDDAMTAQQPHELRRAVERLREIVPPESPIGELVAEAKVHRSNGNSGEYQLSVLRRVADMLSFVPLGEAKLPEGFPTYTPVGMIETKTYPSHRMAMANDFWTLFQHISKNDIAMTTPVRMEYEGGDQGPAQQLSMAFYYGDPEIGEPGKKAAVDVVDHPEHQVVSLGVRGKLSPGVIRSGQVRLEKWLSAHSEYRANGPVRVLGYNSPMVTAEDRFSEIQLPIKSQD